MHYIAINGEKFELNRGKRGESSCTKSPTYIYNIVMISEQYRPDF